MSGWEILNCANHPDRIAVERCEVCNIPLCAYCLYYTEDGQRLCAVHAEQARQAGLRVEAPGTYADQLIGAQVGAARKRFHAPWMDAGLYKGNSTDLMSLIGMLISVISASACCGGSYCVPIVGFVLSLIAVINANQAHDPARTRKLGVVGLLASSVWVVILVSCILLYALSFQQVFKSTWGYQPTIIWGTPTDTPTSAPTDTPTVTVTPVNDEDVAASLHATPAPEP